MVWLWLKFQQTRNYCHLINNGGQNRAAATPAVSSEFSNSLIKDKQKWHERLFATLNWRCQVESSAAPFYQLAKPAGKENADHWLETDRWCIQSPSKYVSLKGLPLRILRTFL